MASTIGTEIAAAYVSLHVKMPGVKNDIQRSLGGSDVQGVLSGTGKRWGAALAGAVGGAVAAVTSKAVGMITSSIGSAVKRVDTLNAFPKQMANMGYSAAEADKAIRKMSDRLVGLPTALDGMAGMVTRIAPLTGGLDKATEVSLALNNALLAGGTSMVLQSNAMEQYAQMLSLGKVDMAAWRSMVSAMPGQLDQMALSLLGAGNNQADLYEAMKDGTVSFEQFNDALLELNSNGVKGLASFEKQARDATGGIGTSWVNLQTAITRNLAEIIERLRPIIDDAMKGISVAFGWVFDAVGFVIDAIMNDLAPAFGSVIDGWSPAIGLALKGISAAFSLITDAVRLLWKSLINEVLPAVAGFFKFLQDNRKPIEFLAGLIGTLLIPHLIVLGVEALRAAVQQVTAWVLVKAEAVKSAVVQVVQSYKIVSAWVLQAAAAVKSGAETVAIWAMLKWEAIRGAAAYAVLSARVAAAWALQSAAAGLSWVKQKAVFLAQKGAYLAQAAAAGVATAATKLWNAALNANPIGLVITAITALVGGLTWFFTQTEVGRKAWGEFMNFLGELWENVKAFFKAAFEFILNLVLNWSVPGLIIKYWDEITAFFGQVWENVKAFFKAAFDAILQLFLKWTVPGLIISNWTAISNFFSQVWNNIVGFVQGGITAVRNVIDTVMGYIRQLWENGWNTVRNSLGNVWLAITGLIQTGWNTVRGILNTLIGFVTKKPAEAFAAARDGIGRAWDAIKEMAKKPVKFVVQTVINGLIDTINKIPGVKLAKLALPRGFSDGGYTGNLPVNHVAGVVHGDEHVIRAESRRRIERKHPGLLDYMNRNGSLFPGYRRGGLVDPLRKGSYTVSQPYHSGHNGIDLAAATGTKVYAAGNGRVQLAGFVRMGGNEVYIQHGNGLGTRYSHLSRFAARAGQQVRAGQVIGYVGSTGMSTGPHLHYMVHRPGLGAGMYGNHVNPAGFMGVQAKDLGEASNPLLGLVDWVAGTVKKAFPSAGMFVDAAAGLAKDTARQAVKHFMNAFGSDTGSAALYDSGGWLRPGLQLVENRSGRPEPVFSSAQWDVLSRNVESGGRFPDRVRLVAAGGEFDAYVERVSGVAARRELAPVAGNRLREELGV